MFLGILRAIIATMELIWRCEQVYVMSEAAATDSVPTSNRLQHVFLKCVFSKMEVVDDDAVTQTKSIVDLFGF